MSFGVFSTGHVLEGTHCLLAEVSDKVPLVLAAEYDYDLLAASEARKLVHDLEAVEQAVHGEYVDGRIGGALASVSGPQARHWICRACRCGTTLLMLRA